MGRGRNKEALALAKQMGISYVHALRLVREQHERRKKEVDEMIDLGNHMDTQELADFKAEVEKILLAPEENDGYGVSDELARAALVNANTYLNSAFRENTSAADAAEHVYSSAEYFGNDG